MIIILTGISLGLLISTIVYIDLKVTRYLEANSKEYRNHFFKDEKFCYANWAKGIEVVGLLAFIALVLAMLLAYGPEEVNHPFLKVILAFLILLIIYRLRAWKYEAVILKGSQLIYTKGRRRKLLKVNLNEVRSVDVNFFRFLIYMNDGNNIKFQTGFKNQAYIYGILKYHRTNENANK